MTDKKNQSPAPTVTEQLKTTMSSMEIAELSGKMHKDVLRFIRNMEAAWNKVNGRNFALVEFTDAKGEKRPMYELSKIECLYIATKFNDEARARLIVRWEELEHKVDARPQLSERATVYTERTIITVRMGSKTNQIYIQDGVVYAKLANIARFMGYNESQAHLLQRWDSRYNLKVEVGKQFIWFISAKGFAELVKFRGNIDFHVVQTVYRDVYGLKTEEEADNPYTYMFTDSEMIKVMQEVNKKPVNKSLVLDMLFNGRKEV